MMSIPRQPERVVILANPASTHAQAIRPQLAEWASGMVCRPTAVTFLETSKDPRQTQERLLRTLERGDWLAIYGGDGTVNQVASTILDYDIFGGDTALPLMPLGGGNANDIANMAYRKATLQNPYGLLRNGVPESVHSLQFGVSKAGETSVYHAIGYLGLGATAFSSLSLNEQRELLQTVAQPLREPLEGIIASNSLLRAASYRIAEKGKVETLYSHLIVNGDRMAKYLRFPMDLTKFQALEFRFRDKNILSLSLAIGQSVLGRINGSVFDAHDERQYTILNPTVLQRDGEVMNIAKNSVLTIAFDQNPIHIVMQPRKS